MAVAIFGLRLRVWPDEDQLSGNKFKPAEAVKLGQQARPREIEKQVLILRDREATDYVSRGGSAFGCVDSRQFQHPEFHHYFKIVNASDINPFARPSRPMVLNAE